MSFGISDSVMSRAVQVCTPELFHKAIQSKVVKDVCAQIEDALESRRRGEMSKEDFETLKSQLKKRLMPPSRMVGERTREPSPAGFPSMTRII